MKTRSLFKTAFSTAVLLAITTGSVQAALVVGSSIQYNDNADRTVSVYSGNSFVSASLGQQPGGANPQDPVSISLGTVSEYTFFNGSSKAVGGYAASGTRVGAVTTSATASNTSNATAVFTTNNPAVDAANFTSSTGITLGGNSITGTVDVTGLASGTLYFIYGSGNGNSRETVFTVSQTGATDVQFAKASESFWYNSDTSGAVTAVSFTNGGTNNLISYSYSGTGGGRFMGVVLSDVVVPEPGSLALMGLGGLCVLRRRRD